VGPFRRRKFGRWKLTNFVNWSHFPLTDFAELTPIRASGATPVTLLSPACRPHHRAKVLSRRTYRNRSSRGEAVHLEWPLLRSAGSKVAVIEPVAGAGIGAKLLPQLADFKALCDTLPESIKLHEEAGPVDCGRRRRAGCGL
jgi:hypothetical protein